MTAPFVLTIDTRENLPYSFDGLTADAKQGGGPLLVTTVRGTVPSGDYSLAGHLERIAVERKSAADLYRTVAADRARFERELTRLARLAVAAVVVEAEWSELFGCPPRYTRFTPKSLIRSVLAWQQRYPTVQWHFLPGRIFAEAVTFRILERYHRDLTSGRTAPPTSAAAPGPGPSATC